MSNPKRHFPHSIIQTNFTNGAMPVKRARDGPGPILQTPMPPYSVLRKEAQPSHNDDRTSEVAGKPPEQRSDQMHDTQRQENSPLLTSRTTLTSGVKSMILSEPHQQEQQQLLQQRQTSLTLPSTKSSAICLPSPHRRSVPYPRGRPRCQYCVDTNLACRYQGQ